MPRIVNRWYMGGLCLACGQSLAGEREIYWAPKRGIMHLQPCPGAAVAVTLEQATDLDRCRKKVAAQDYARKRWARRA